eukprot:CAMPEP_0198730974 /NCGR_PEP_ID=MMETSP1475-20131203/27349_1 /TAXON_ID= ORGANISM="Unidentified sp., Strain CCMP1999" /NCGR_SAMPLE_ID=MMETSP1475 /ASSEMBLY_ACC=CAM_ASM_001111 /LENGTH=274 /DNA_ID=CAMNT_0044493867 /DNA_START=56 /DNA_END=877 /DNA_ORIENTATION=+
MDLMGVVARVNGLSNDYIIESMNEVFEVNVLGRSFARPVRGVPLLQMFALAWAFIYFGTVLLYFAAAGLDYLVFFVLLRKKFIPDYKPNYKDMRREISMSLTSLVVMAAMVAPFEMGIIYGHSRLYTDVRQYGIVYFLISPLLFILFSDFIIYWVHRWLHHGLIYKHIHKPHHSFIHTTPFAAFAFHPIDGFAQGVAYQIFVFCFPLHSFLHMVSLAIVGLWTINIHDRVDLRIPFVNGAGHHQVHHLTFRSNYGQYFVFSDKLFGTFKDPEKW